MTSENAGLLNGNVCLVTGASSGIGAALAAVAKSAGATVIATDISIPDLRFDLCVAMDVTDAEACRNCACQVLERFGPVSVLVNSAGVLSDVPLQQNDFERSWRHTISVNLDGTLNVIRAFSEQLSQTNGRVINLASIAAFFGSPSGSAYVASKHGVAGLTKSLAVELGPRGIRINALAPGRIETPMTAAYRDEPSEKARYLSRTPLGRYGKLEDLAGPFLFLASHQSDYVSGAILPIDGGFHAG